MSKPVKTQGNFMVYGPDGERIAAFAIERDKRLFEAAPEMYELLKQTALWHIGHRIHNGSEIGMWRKDAAALLAKIDKGGE